METKYDFFIREESFITNNRRLVNQLWKLIPMKENEEDWQMQLKTVINEIQGLNEIFRSCPQFIQLLSKLEGLLLTNENFHFYRKTVFECISLLQEISHGQQNIK